MKIKEEDGKTEKRKAEEKGVLQTPLILHPN
jgi:hypothetical protein